MNNLTQTQKDAKEAYLNQCQERLLKMYNIACKNERQAVVRHINAFLPIVSEDEKIFWLKFISQMEKIENQPQVLFPLGKVFMTVGAREVLEESNQSANEFLIKHQSGDYGIICEDDRKENELSVKEGFRILSAYKTEQGEKIYVITEADRVSTTILLPEEY